MGQDLWVFGYGSLMWNPGFAAEEAVPADLPGFRRAFCLRSVHYRGTPEAPGLVLGLDRAPGRVCAGLAYRVGAGAAAAVLDYLRRRELVSYAYAEEVHPAILADGRRIDALAYVLDPAHPQYCGGLTLEAQAAVIAHAQGPAGSNRDYLERTLDSLAALGIADDELLHLARLVRAKVAGVDGAG
jgi:cation transport protein ChaC